ncbi:MAG: HypC/HybG/HupF family hydrogenase formation chaperone [Spirochaetes bacterium]|nr:MAG: HypC/HybG/HupF family hydrogenase formation chaperone [Spirochaetota bacterium]
MCLAIPMEIIEISGRKATARAYGVTRQVDITMTPDVTLGDKVIIHAGFVIEKLDPEAALEIEAAWDEYNTIMDEEEKKKRINEC